MRSTFRRVFSPTKEEIHQQCEFLRKIHRESAKKRGCNTCANCVQVRHYPGFVTGEECECTLGLKCDTMLDTVRNCEKYVYDNIEEQLKEIEEK